MPTAVFLDTKRCTLGCRVLLEDTPIERTASGIIKAAYGCAGERCMALPAIVVHALVAEVVRKANKLQVGPADDKSIDLGPVISLQHKQRVEKWIQKGIDEGAEIVLDGRYIKVSCHENGFYLGPTFLDHVNKAMTVGERGIFGAVLCVKRVKSFEEGLAVMNANPFAIGLV